MAGRSTHGIFCRTYHKDAERLLYLLGSIEKYCSGFDQVVVTSPLSSESFIKPIVSRFSFAHFKSCNTWSSDYIAQQITKLTSDRYIDTDYITHIDSDCVICRDLSPELLFEDDLPVLYHAPYSYFYENNYHMPWQSPTSALLQASVNYEFMRRFPLTYPRQIYIELQNYFEAKHGEPIDKIFNFIHGDLLSEFNLIGGFSYMHGSRFHKHINQTVETPRQPFFVKQMCLMNARDDRSLTAEDRSLLRETFNATELRHLNMADQGQPSEIEQPISPSAEVIEPSKLIGDRKGHPVGKKRSFLSSLKQTFSVIGNKVSSEAMHSSAILEMQTFKNAQLWDGGYIDADPLLPLSWSSYSNNGFVSVYYATYLACIKPYIYKGSKVMEIGPGRGVWTKAMIIGGAERVYALDVQSRETNMIDSLLGSHADKLEYIVANDLSGDGVPNNIDFFFSFGTFVHLSKQIQAAYFSTIASKLRKGAHGFIQIADLKTWNRVVSDQSLKIDQVLSSKLPELQRKHVAEIFSKSEVVSSRETVDESWVLNEDVAPGRYFYVGTEWVAETLSANGLEIIDSNVIENLRDPIIHFQKS